MRKEKSTAVVSEKKGIPSEQAKGTGIQSRNKYKKAKRKGITFSNKFSTNKKKSKNNGKEKK